MDIREATEEELGSASALARRAFDIALDSGELRMSR